MTKIYDLIYLDSRMYMVDKEAKDEDFVIYGRSILILSNKNLYNTANEWACLPNREANPVAYSRIVASTQPSLGLPILPKPEEGIDKLSKDNIFRNLCTDSNEERNFDIGFVEGYKAASTKKYTEEDMGKLLEWAGGEEGFNLIDEGESTKSLLDKFLVTLNPPPKQVEVSVDYLYNTTNHSNEYIVDVLKDNPSKIVPKVDANNIVSVIRYIYE